MTYTIKCKYCGKEIEITEALQQKIEEQLLAAERIKHQKELEEAKAQAEEKAAKKVKLDLGNTIKQLQESNDEEKLRNRRFQEQLEELTKELRKTRQEKEDVKLEMQRKLMEEEEKIKQEARKRTEEEHRLKDLQKEKKLQDALKVNEELRRKLEQGSQQAQGEVLELEVEAVLRNEFPEDEIEEVKKGTRGADVKQNVIDKSGRRCGMILWETKNAQWSEGWIKKLKEDQREAKAQLAVLVVANPPENVETFTYKNGVWITTRKLIVGLSFALRFDLIHLHHEKQLSVGKNEKMEVLYQYLTGTEFRHRVEAIVEAFSCLQDDIEKEKRWFNTKWARQEKEIRKIIDNTHGLYGDLQAVSGRALQQIKKLELPSGDSETED